MLRVFIKLGILVSIFMSTLCFNPLNSRTYPTEKMLNAQIKAMKSEIKDLQLSVRSLDQLHDKLSRELVDFEASFKANLVQSIVPLMQWPEGRFSIETKSWVQWQRSKKVLEELRRKLVAEPLKLMADRELRIAEVKNLREELSGQLDEIEAKESLLSLQLDELRSMNRKKTKRVPQARSSNKLRIGDIEGNEAQP